MIHLNSEIRLTDELERQLMQEAIEEQARFKPGKALKNLFVKLNGSSKQAAGVKVAPRNVESAA
ncbi:hypothetical protein CSC67_10850 [Pusillimonas caeni]|uniref:hypothetical protein n=1 Tax=Pusillimonas caeni TaxID=1348472 RepID=UPI000E5A09CE|nr:hypothetical protein [Pusillimonas caeni]TFL13742.1 hypothetical protein CSC67_10850 [Pusillimonas caeni]